MFNPLSVHMVNNKPHVHKKTEQTPWADTHTGGPESKICTNNIKYSLQQST